jgi:hypothetical protein
VLGEVAREWDDLRRSGFGWLISLLPPSVQERATAGVGGFKFVRGATWASIVFTGATAVWMGLAPTALNLLTAAAFGVESLFRAQRAARGMFAPSLLASGLADYLRPERLAYRAHREAERAVLQQHGA